MSDPNMSDLLLESKRRVETQKEFYAKGYAQGVADERARVVADLRARAKTQKSWTGESMVAAVLRAEADRIEGGGT